MANIPLPSLDAFAVFESAARHQSFTKAAAELNVSQSAVSRQIWRLEDRLGVRLFSRRHGGVVPTEAGRAYLIEVRFVLESLETATMRLITAGQHDSVLYLAVLPDLTTHWLVPRLPDFLTRHPNVSISCGIRQAPFDFGTDPFDAAFHLGPPTWGGAVIHHLMDQCVVPVCTPAFRAAHQIHRLDDLNRVPLLQLASRPADWASWFDKSNLPQRNAFRGLMFDNLAMLSAAAVAGLGIALLPTFFVDADLCAKKLVRLADPQRTEDSYYLVVPEGKAGSPQVSAFVRWVEHMKPRPASPVRRDRDIVARAAARSRARDDVHCA